MLRWLIIFHLLIYIVSAKRGSRINIFSQKNGEGDIVQLHRINNGIMRNALPQNSPDRWINLKSTDGQFIIPYKVTGDFDLEETSIIMDAMKRIAHNTCIRFQPWKNEEDFVEVQNRQNEGCYTIVGRQPGRNVVMLEANDRATCVEPDIVIHELFHTIGLWHEHMRADRDQYIRVHFENIPSYYQSQFEKVTPNEATTYDIPYDYRSVMHYAEDAFAKPTTISMETLNREYQDIIGKANDAAQSDYAKICLMYGCGTCMGKRYDPQTLVNQLKVNPNNGENPDSVPLFPPAPPLPISSSPSSLNSNERLDRDCMDVSSSLCSMISSGRYLISCSTLLTSRLCCLTCKSQNNNHSQSSSSSFLSFLGR